MAYKVDISSCDEEPINFISAIQPHGFLVAAAEENLKITYFSENTFDHWPQIANADRSELTLEQFLGGEVMQELQGIVLNPSVPEVYRPWRPKHGPNFANGKAYTCLPHRFDGQIVLEYLASDTPSVDLFQEDRLRQIMLTELVRPGGLYELARTSAKLIRMVTGFDRVMIYRFAEDQHGEVIAESTSRPDSFLGLHYPASDIPEPARKHFFLNVIRHIPNIRATSSRIISAANTSDVSYANDAVLDLTYSKLRAVSPIHIEYLGNMGVDASMSISLVSQDKLWGLVACHHYAPKQISTPQIRFCEFLGATISSLLQSLESASHLAKGVKAEKISKDLEAHAHNSVCFIDSVIAHSEDILRLAGAQGMIASVAGVVRTAGVAPKSEMDFRPLRSHLRDGMVFSSNLSSLLDLSATQAIDAAGATYMELSEDGQDYLVLFRPNFEHAIKWAGKPEKITKKMDDGTFRLSPRGSFALWREERRGHSRPFDESDREALRILRRALFALNSLERERRAVKSKQNAEVEQTKLRVALLDAARMASMGELASALAHELTQPLSAVANYMNASKEHLKKIEADIPEQVEILMTSAVDESSRAANLVRRLRNFIAKGNLVVEHISVQDVVKESVEIASSAHSGQQPEICLSSEADLPKVWADPVQLGLVILNITRNSLAAMDVIEKPCLTAEITSRDEMIQVRICDNGTGIHESLLEEIFEPFHTSTTNGMGIGLSLCRSIIEAHGGKIWANPKPSGAEIAFTLPIEPGTHDKHIRDIQP